MIFKRAEMPVRPALSLVLGLSLAFAAHAQTQALNEPAARITDSRIAKDYQSYQNQQTAIRALNDSGKHGINSYSIAKAQCWLDVSFHEFTRNDRSRFTQDALNESFRITEYLRSGQTLAAPQNGDQPFVNGSNDKVTENPASQTLLLNNGQRLRTDLWDQASAYKSLAAYGGPTSCGQRQVACAEVELAHAGNEINQQGWRHARPYIQLAEDYLTAAKSAIDQCAPVYVAQPVYIAPPPPPPLPAVVLPPIQLPPVQLPPVQLPPLPPLPVAVNLGAEVLFAYNKRAIGDVRDYTMPRLDDLIAQIKSGKFKVNAINLTGHADRTNATGVSDYNNQLSQDRANAVKDYMVSKGVAANQITVDAKADGIPVEACQTKFKSAADLQECLLPNRRVVITVNGVR
jgi:outer membrane protein OmpA-like peptidoglycan-associated protein